MRREIAAETGQEAASRLLDLASPFTSGAGPRSEFLLRASQARCVDGMNKADMANSHRLALVTGLPGLVLPTGTVVAEPNSQIRPANTTWLRFPGNEGQQFFAPINCVKFHATNIYRLARADVHDLMDFPPTPPLLDVPLSTPLGFLLGIRWTYRPTDRSMSFLVRLLCGSLDYDRGLFRAFGERDIVKLDTRTDEVRYGFATEALGPEPDLAPRKRRDLQS